MSAEELHGFGGRAENLDWSYLKQIGVPRMLRDASSQIRFHGWCQGGTTIGDGVDILGALALAARVPKKHLTNSIDTMWENAAPTQAARLIASWEFLDVALEDPIAWNDHPERTGRQVILKLTQLADALDATL